MTICWALTYALAGLDACHFLSLRQALQASVLASYICLWVCSLFLLCASITHSSSLLLVSGFSISEACSRLADLSEAVLEGKAGLPQRQARLFSMLGVSPQQQKPCTLRLVSDQQTGQRSNQHASLNSLPPAAKEASRADRESPEHAAQSSTMLWRKKSGITLPRKLAVSNQAEASAGAAAVRRAAGQRQKQSSCAGSVMSGGQENDARARPRAKVFKLPDQTLKQISSAAEARQELGPSSSRDTAIAGPAGAQKRPFGKGLETCEPDNIRPCPNGSIGAWPSEAARPEATGLHGFMKPRLVRPSEAKDLDHVWEPPPAQEAEWQQKEGGRSKGRKRKPKPRADKIPQNVQPKKGSRRRQQRSIKNRTDSLVQAFVDQLTPEIATTVWNKEALPQLPHATPAFEFAQQDLGPQVQSTGAVHMGSSDAARLHVKQRDMAVLQAAVTASYASLAQRAALPDGALDPEALAFHARGSEKDAGLPTAEAGNLAAGKQLSPRQREGGPAPVSAGAEPAWQAAEVPSEGGRKWVDNAPEGVPSKAAGGGKQSSPAGLMPPQVSAFQSQPSDQAPVAESEPSYLAQALPREQSAGLEEAGQIAAQEFELQGDEWQAHFPPAFAARLRLAREPSVQTAGLGRVKAILTTISPQPAKLQPSPGERVSLYGLRANF